MNNETYVQVPEIWLKTLARLAEQVKSQMDSLPAADHSVLIKLDIASLTGFASSAQTLIKFNKQYEI